MKQPLRHFRLLLCLALAGPVAAADIEVRDAWIREAPPGAPMLAGYLCLFNRGETPATLTGVTSPRFAHVMMHRTETRDGVARMRHLAEVTLAPGRQECFAPGGMHLMMPAPDQPPHAGDRVELTLHFADGDSRRVVAAVRAP